MASDGREAPVADDGGAERRHGWRRGSADDGSDALRQLPPSDWFRLWTNRRAKNLPEAIAREIQLSITSLSLDVTTFVTSLGLFATTVMVVSLVPLSTPIGKLWLALQASEYCVLLSSIWYLRRSRRRGTLTAAQFNRVLLAPTVMGGIFWGGLPAVVGSDSVELFYLALMVSALACSVGYFWTLGHWPLSILFASIILTSITVIYSVNFTAGETTILLLGPLLFVALVGTSINAQIVLVRSYYFEATARDREQTIGLILDDYDRGGQDFLWETDANLRFSHVPRQMVNAAHGDPRVCLGASLEALLQAEPAALAEVRANRPFNVRIAAVGPTGRGELRLWGRPKIFQKTLLGYHGVGSDADAARRAAESQRASERLDAMVALTSGLAHDFNNQLATVLGAVELAALDPTVTENTLGYLNRAVDACLRTRRITADLVVASGYDATYEATAFELGPAVDEVADDLHTLFPDLELTVRYESTAWVLADRDHYIRAVRNLMQNACQAVSAMPTDFRRVAVRIHTVGPPGGPRFACTDVSDSGPGVPTELTERIFEPFSTTRRASGGTGLGLSVARGFAHQAGGQLTLEPTSRGASFRLVVPLAEAPACSTPTAIEPVTTGAATPKPSFSGRFLVIEDDQRVADNVATLLRSLGATADVAGSVAEAIERFRGRTAGVECVISDLVLPDGNGYDVIAALREEQSDLRAVYMSGFTPTLPADVAPELRCPFIAKPFSVAELAEILDAIGVSTSRTSSTRTAS